MLRACVFLSRALSGSLRISDSFVPDIYGVSFGFNCTRRVSNAVNPQQRIDCREGREISLAETKAFPTACHRSEPTKPATKT
jgi:hypothetical protein